MVSLDEVRKQAGRKAGKLILTRILPETATALKLNGIDLNKLAGLLIDEWAAKELKVKIAPQSPTP